MIHWSVTIPVTLMHGYVCWRAGTVPVVQRRITRRWRIIIAIALWVLFYVGGGYLEWSISVFLNWVAILFLISLVLLAVDIVTGFGFFLSRIAGQLRGMVLVTGLLLSATAVVQGYRPPVVTEHEVTIKGLPAELDGTVLAAIADTHVGITTGPDWLEARVEQILEMQPDLIVLIGDIIESHGDNRAELTSILKSLDAPLGVWLVRGNHESKSSIETFEKAGIRLLQNESVEISPGFVLAGVDQVGWENNRDSLHCAAFSETLAGRPEGATVLLCHEPVRIAQAEQAGVELMLSGHTHGGQVWPFGYYVLTMYEYLAGRYEVDDMTLLVSRGTGTWGPRMRLWRRGEILRITLRSEK